MKSYFSERLKLIREQRGLTLDNIAAGIQSHKSTLSQYETGNRRPDYDMIKKVSEYLRVSTDYMLGLTDDPNGGQVKNRITDYHQITGLIREYLSNNDIPQADKDDLFKDISAIYWKNKK